MGVAVLILGASGSGKSTSLRNFKRGEVCVLNVAGKPLPFRGNLDVVNNATYESIWATLKDGEYLFIQLWHDGSVTYASKLGYTVQHGWNTRPGEYAHSFGQNPDNGDYLWAELQF